MKDGTFAEHHTTPKDQENMISEAIKSDFKEAKDELTNVGKGGGFAWGIRQMLFGGPSPRDRNVLAAKEKEQSSTTEQPRTT